MSLLPQSMLPPATPIGKVFDKDGKETGNVLIEQNWWLLIYNLTAQVLGASGPVGLPATALIEMAGADSDAADTDAIALRQPVSNLAVQLYGLPEDDSYALRTPLATALLLAQDALLPDPVAQAQPALSVSVGASPFTYTLPFTGSVAVNGGTVSVIAIVRQGTSVTTGVTAGVIPASRGDGIRVTYSVLPTMTFLPT